MPGEHFFLYLKKRAFCRLIYSTEPGVVMLMLAFSLTLLAADPHEIAQKTSPAKQIEQANPVLSESLNSGRYIRLSDNSLWEINPGDTAITQSWITPVEIIASPSGNATYPYKLTNSLTGSSVLARRVSSTGSATPAAPKPKP
jgi:hypothetical protein